MNMVQTCVAYIGRILLSAIFLFSSILEMMNWASTEEYFLMHMTRWINTFQGSDLFASFFAGLVPWLSWILLIAMVFKVIGSLLLILGWKVRLGAFLLVMFLIPTTLIIHDFWTLSPQEQSIEMIMFMKNLSILGGLFVVLALGKGNASAKSH